MMDAWTAVVFILTGLIILAMYRLFRGPTVPDRVVALDVINTFTVASMVILSVVTEQPVMVDVAIVYAFLSFVGTLYIAGYLGGDI
ncbi:MAG: monovalent cation/H+ antiporter complex subunit F [Methanoculleaceae archaeon]